MCDHTRLQRDAPIVNRQTLDESRRESGSSQQQNKHVDGLMMGRGKKSSEIQVNITFIAQLSSIPAAVREMRQE